MTLVLVFSLVLLVGVLISGAADRSVLSTAVLFLGAGVLLGDGMLGVLDLRAGDEAVGALAELALFSVLFTDGQRVAVRDLRSAWRLPGRALVLGMPLTFLVTATAGMVLLGVPWAEALLQAAVAWFGPKGFASVVYGLIVLESGARHADEMFHLIALTVALSILAHSSSDVPIAKYFARARARSRRSEDAATLNCEDEAAPRYLGLPAGERARRERPDTAR